MHMQIHSGDDPDSTAHQDVPVAETVKNSVPSQNLEATVSNMLIFPCILIVCCIAEESARTYVVEMSAVVMSPMRHGIGAISSVTQIDLRSVLDDCCVQLLIIMDGKCNHSMGSPMDGTPPQSED